MELLFGVSPPATKSLDELVTIRNIADANGYGLDRIAIDTSIIRGLDYYTGFVFELHDQEMRAGRQLVAGGRYDELLSRLGATTPIPAVGFSVWIERLNEIGAEP